MIDFRKLSLPHDLRSQLGLKDPVAIAQDLCRAINGEPSVLGDRIIAEQEAMRAEIGEALRIEAKPLNPANATPDPLHKTIAAMGCSSKTWGMRNALAVNKLFSATGTSTSNVVVNVVNNGEPPTDQNAAEIVANIRKMIDSPEVQRLRTMRQIGEASQVIDAAEKSWGIAAPGNSERIFDVRAIADLIPDGAVLIKGSTVNEYLAAHSGIDPVIVKEGDITAAHPITTDLASVLRGIGISTKGGPINLTEPGKPIPRATNFRALPKVNDCLDTTESDVLELLVLAGANPHTDRRRLDAARTQFELAFMMLKKAVDPEQERE